MRYEFIIYWSKADGSFIVEVPELAGCMADGATYEEAVANAKEAVQEWLKFTINTGLTTRSNHGFEGCYRGEG